MHKFLLAALLLAFAPLSIAKADIDTSKPLDLMFTALDGRQVDISKMRGKVVLIDFWATWCPPCRVISPDLVRLYKKYHSQGLEIIGISVDSDKKGLLDVIKEEGIPWPQYFDGMGSDNAMAEHFGIEQFPTILLVDKKGMIARSDFANEWLDSGVMHRELTDETKKKVDAALEKYLKAP